MKQKHNDKPYLIIMWATIIICFLYLMYKVLACHEPVVKTNESLPQQDSSQVVNEELSASPSLDNYTLGIIHDVPLDIQTQFFVQNLCEKYTLDASIIYGMMYVESRFSDSDTDGNVIGIMQTDVRYMPAWLSGETYNSQLEQDITAGIKALTEWRKVCETKGHKYDLYYLLGTYNQGYDYFQKPNDDYAQQVIDYTLTLKNYIIIKE